VTQNFDSQSHVFEVLLGNMITDVLNEEKTSLIIDIIGH